VASEYEGRPETSPDQEEELLVIEAIADDDEEDGELYALPDGMGAISLKLPRPIRRGISEDDEVVVIEREEQPQLIPGAMSVWIRTTGGRSWRQGGAPAEALIESQLAQYGFDDEDDVATEVAQFTEDGLLQSRRVVKLDALAEDEDEEIILPPHGTRPLGKPEFSGGDEVTDSGWDPEEGKTRIMPERQVQVARDHVSPRLRFDVPTVSLPAQAKNEQDTRIIPRQEAGGGGEISADDEKTQLYGDGDGIRHLRTKGRLEFGGGGAAAKGGRSSIEGPVAKLAPTPAEPLKPSKAPPLSSRPVPVMPSEVRRMQENNSRMNGLVTERKDYFTSHKRSRDSWKWPLLLGVLLVGGIAGAVYGAIGWQKMSAVNALTEQVHAALEDGHYDPMVKAYAAVRGSEYKREQPNDDLSLYLKWHLFGSEGIQFGATPPEDSTLDDVAVGVSSLPVLLCRTERDLMRRYFVAGRAFTKKVVERFPEEPAGHWMLGRFVMATAGGDAGKLDAAIAHFNKALSLDNKISDVPVARAAVLTSIGEAMLRKGAPGAKAKFEEAMHADGKYLWADIGMAMMEAQKLETNPEKDEVLKRLLDRVGAELGPRQHAAVEIQRGRWAFEYNNIEEGMKYLNGARVMDIHSATTQHMLTDLYLDQGRVKLAQGYAKKALAEAPYDPSIISSQVRALSMATKLAEARDALSRMPAEYQETPYARLAKARILHASGDLDGAMAQLELALKAEPGNFEFKNEQAQLYLDMGKKDEAKALIDVIVDEALPAARPGAMPALIAQQAILQPAAMKRDMVREAYEQVSQNASALLVLSKDLLDERLVTDARAWLEFAEGQGSLPEITLLLARIDSKDKHNKELALERAQKVQAGCGEGPICEEAAKLVETLQ